MSKIKSLISQVILKQKSKVLKNSHLFNPLFINFHTLGINYTNNITQSNVISIYQSLLDFVKMFLRQSKYTKSNFEFGFNNMDGI